MMSHRPIRLCLLFFNLFFPFLYHRFNNFHCPIYNFFPFPFQTCLWIPQINFWFGVLFISRYFWVFLGFLIISIFILFIHQFSWVFLYFSLALWTSLGQFFLSLYLVDLPVGLFFFFFRKFQVMFFSLKESYFPVSLCALWLCVVCVCRHVGKPSIWF